MEGYTRGPDNPTVMNVDQFLSSMRRASSATSSQESLPISQFSQSKNDSHAIPLRNVQHNMSQTKQPTPRQPASQALMEPRSSSNIQFTDPLYRPPHISTNVPFRPIMLPRFNEQPNRQQVQSTFHMPPPPFNQDSRLNWNSPGNPSSVRPGPDQSVKQHPPQMRVFSSLSRPQMTFNPQRNESVQHSPSLVRPNLSVTESSTPHPFPQQQFVSPVPHLHQGQLLSTLHDTNGTSQAPVSNSESNAVKNTEKIDFQRKIDQDWVNGWLLSLNKKEKPTARKSLVTVANYKCCLQEAMKLKEELNRLTSLLENDMDSEEWQQKVDQASKTKLRLETLNQILTDEVTLENIKQLCFKRKAKRERLKRQRHELYVDKQAELARREELHRTMDAVQERLLQKSLHEKQEKEMKATADKVMSEVRRKLVETAKTIELINGLRKLRELRCQSVYTKGMYLGMESDNNFEASTEKLLTLLENQKKVYETEERTLKVMLETEQEETKERERENKRRLQEEKERSEKRQMLHCLFGKGDILGMDDPLLPYKQFYRQAESSVDSLVAIRQSWDMYLVPEFTPGSSAIPVDWVWPDQPSSDAWASALKHQEINKK